VVVHQELEVDLVKGARLVQLHNINLKNEVLQGVGTGLGQTLDANLKTEVDQVRNVDLDQAQGTSQFVVIQVEGTGLGLFPDVSQGLTQNISRDLALDVDLDLVQNIGLDLAPDIDLNQDQDVSLGLFQDVCLKIEEYHVIAQVSHDLQEVVVDLGQKAEVAHLNTKEV